MTGVAREFGRVVVPLAGLDSDGAFCARAAAVADRLGAELVAAFTPPDPAELTPWLGEGFVGGVQAAAVESLQDAAEEAESAARTAFESCSCSSQTFVRLESPVWRSLSGQCRLADLVIFDGLTARGGSPLSAAFEQVLIEERSAVLVLRGDIDPFASAIVAWDGAEPAARAARRAAPLLRHAASVTVLSVDAGERTAGPEALVDYYARRGIDASARTVPRGEGVPETLLATARDEGAGLLVAGAFGRSRLREFIFGGTTRALIGAESPSLFTAH